MSSPRLTPEQLELARKLLDEIRERLAALSGGDRDLVFAYRRKVYKELMHDERKPMVRRRLKLLKMKEQQGTKGELKGTEGIMSLDRRGPMIELPRAGVRVRF
ncbi:hypothetical protein [Luteimonas notoginsengisoli]|uniref:Transposase n=1 Tax=Luteimonas notoginsengisoli TaxID=1578200 RepID=A0ABV7UYF5_9GAMM